GAAFCTTTSMPSARRYDATYSAICCSPAPPGTSVGFTESMATRSRSSSIVSSRKIHLESAFLLDRAIVNDRRGGRVLESDAGRIEDEDFIVTRAASLLADDDLAELRVHVIARHRAVSNRRAEIADRRRLLGDVGDDF